MSLRSELERERRILEGCEQVRDSNRKLAEFAVEEARLWKARAKFHEGIAKSLRIGYNHMSRELMTADRALYEKILRSIDDDFHPGEEPHFHNWRD